MITKLLLKSILTMAGKILSVAIYLLTILAAYAGHVNPEVWALPSVLTLTLPYVALLTVVLTIVWIIRKKIIFSALGIVTIIICLTSLRTIFPMHFPKEAKKGQVTFSLMSWNICRGEDFEHPDSTSRSRSVDYIINSGVDIVCLQEVYSKTVAGLKDVNKEQLERLYQVYPYRTDWTFECEMQVLSKYPVEKLAVNPSNRAGNERHSYVFDVDIKGHHLILTNVHLSSYHLNSEDREIVTQIHGVKSAEESVKDFKGSVFGKLKAGFKLRAADAEYIVDELDDNNGPLIVCGDFNDVPTSWAYRTLIKAGFKDAHEQTAFWPTFTYNAHRFYFHIDHILYRGALEPLNWKRGDIKTSDHYPQTATFAFTNQKR